MTDLLVFEAPLGILGRLAERLFLRRYLGKLLADRARPAITRGNWGRPPAKKE